MPELLLSNVLFATETISKVREDSAITYHGNIQVAQTEGGRGHPLVHVRERNTG